MRYYYSLNDDDRPHTSFADEQEIPHSKNKNLIFIVFLFVIKCYCRAGPIPFVTRPHQIVTTLHSWFSSYLKAKTYVHAFRNNHQCCRRRNNMHLTVYLIACRVQCACAHYLGQSKPIVYTHRDLALCLHIVDMCTCVCVGAFTIHVHVHMQNCTPSVQ